VTPFVFALTLCIDRFDRTKPMAADWSGNQREEEAAEEEDREVTPVGRAPEGLLELAATGDQNTRAYQAPQELLELARRQQAKRAQGGHSRPAAAPVRAMDADAAPPRPISESLPPRERPTRGPAGSQRLESSTPSISIGPASSSLEAIESSERSLDPLQSSAADAAPSVARSRPSRLDEEAGVPSSSSAASLSDLAQAAADPDAPPSTAAPSPDAVAPESAASSSFRALGQRLPLAALAVLVGICLAIGFILAKWRGLDHLFPRH
jgi:hypothetical protein